MTRSLGKIMALLILAIFIVSVVPLAWAEDNSTEDTPEQVSEVEDGSVEDVTKEATKERKEFGKELKQKFEEKKVEIKEKAEEIRANHEEWIKEKSDKIKEQYESKKKELEQLKEKRSACGGEGKNNSTDCEDKKLELKKGVKQHLINTLNLIDDSYARMIQKVNQSTGLTEDEKQTLLTQVASLEENLLVQKAKVEAMADNSTNAEFKDAIKELKKVWQDTQKAQHRLMASLISSRMDSIAEKHNEFQTSLDAKIEQLKQKGVDTTELETLAEKFKQQTEQLNLDRVAAEEAWVAAINKDSLEQSKEATGKVKEDLKQTQQTLREFLEKFRELNRTANRKVVENNQTATEV
ncbi:MAG: hypothetical protein WCV90_02325 [Candidatus Woesearchaeota archaeon]|jgi:hypothetical protein